MCQLRAGMGVSPRGVSGGCLGCLPSPTPLHAPLERTPRWAGPAARRLLRPVQAAREAGLQAALWTGNPRASHLLFIAGEALAGPGGAAPRSCGWARPPAGRPRATFPLFTPPGLRFSLLLTQRQSRHGSVAPMFTAHALQLHHRGAGEGRGG